jgi:hypothetical protein
VEQDSRTKSTTEQKKSHGKLTRQTKKKQHLENIYNFFSSQNNKNFLVFFVK